MANRKPLLQWTMWELVGVLSVAMAVVGLLWAGNFVFRLVMLLTLLIPVVWLIIAVTGRGEWRTFGWGSTLAVVSFGLALIMTQHQIIRSIDGASVTIPTLSISAYARKFVDRKEYFLDGERLPNSHELTLDEDGTVRDAAGDAIGSIYGGMGSRGGGGGMSANGAAIEVRSLPTSNTFLAASHVFWLLLLGYLGGKFAVGFARFQDRQEEIAASNG